MQNVLVTTYKNGAFVPDQKLYNMQEGKKFTVMLIDEEEKDGKNGKKESFFSFVKEHSFRTPEGYKFNREEIYDR